MAQTILDSTTQHFLDIYDITNDLVIMKDGTTSIIITVDAMNFGLLAEEEQDAVMYAYAGLLNSLNYPIQIIIRSQTKDVTGYLQRLKEQEDSAQTRKNQQRIARYREFVANLIHERNVLDKKFYVVIPATGLELGLLSAQSVLPGSKTFDVSSVEKTVIIEKAKNLLEPKRDHIISQFARIGLYSRQLNTQEIIQLFYVSYNPEATEGQGIGDSKSYTTPLVKASVESPAMINATAMPPTTPAQTNVPVPAITPEPAVVQTPAPVVPEPVIAQTTTAALATPVVPTEVASPTLPSITEPITTSVAPPQPSQPTYTPSIPMAQDVSDVSAAPSAVPPVAPSTIGTEPSVDTSVQDEINKTLGALPATPSETPLAKPSMGSDLDIGTISPGTAIPMGETPVATQAAPSPAALPTDDSLPPLPEI